MPRSFPDDHPITCEVLERTVFSKFTFDDDPPERLFDAAHRVGLFPTVYRYFQHRDHNLPQSASERWRRHVLRLAALRGQLDQILELLEPSIDTVLLKGEPLGDILFGDRRARQTTDIDLLVRPAQLDEAIRRLQEEGYEPDKTSRPQLETSNQFRLIHPSKPGVVELHWLIADPWVPSPTSGELFASASRRQIDNLEVEYLSSPMVALHLFLHFHNHMGYLKSLVDVAAWLDSHSEQPEALSELRDLARRHHGAGVIDWPLLVLAKWHRSVPETDNPSRGVLALARLTEQLYLRGDAGGWVSAFPGLDGPQSGGTPLTVMLRAATALTIDGHSRRLYALLLLALRKTRSPNLRRSVLRHGFSTSAQDALERYTESAAS
jgi:hypothetical protein